MNKREFSGARILAGAFLLAGLAGCATGPGANPEDPLEPFNRAVTGFNEGVDKAVLKPVATVYRDITPRLVRTGVTNFFANLGDAWSLVNNLLQLKPEASGDSLMRFTVNTFMGLGGVIDIASDMRIPRHKEDFGQTLGYWGVPSGAYVVLPLLGPSTIRDTAALPVDMQGNLVGQIDHVPTRNVLTALRVVNLRANLLRAGEVLDDAALDKYSFTRDVYLQLRQAEVQDRPASESGSLPAGDDDDGKLPE